MTLVILVGLPGCGKSHFAKDVCPNHLVVSSDAIREQLLGDATDQSGNKEVFAKFHRDIEDGLRHGRQVVADSTGLDKFAREKLRKIAKDTDSKTHVFVFTDIQKAFERNKGRGRVVPFDAMKRMNVKLAQALVDIPNENYDCVTEIEEYGK